AADGADGFFVVERGRGTRLALIDDETNGVGADIHDGDRPPRPRARTTTRRSPSVRRWSLGAAHSVPPRDDSHRTELLNLEGSAAAGKGRIRHEVSMRRKRIRRRGFGVTGVGSVAIHVP